MVIDRLPHTESIQQDNPQLMQLSELLSDLVEAHFLNFFPADLDGSLSRTRATNLKRDFGMFGRIFVTKRSYEGTDFIDWSIWADKRRWCGFFPDT
jgi:hypothetical protein